MTAAAPPATPSLAPPEPSVARAAVAGIAAGLVAIAAGELFAGLVAGASSVVVAVGDLVIALQPPGAKELIVGLFGANDGNPSPEQTARIEAALKEHSKEYEFHTYDDAGHAFFSVDRPNFNVAAANDGWQRIWDFFERHLAA